jgi:phospholipid transport system substrate-binding protein
MRKNRQGEWKLRNVTIEAINLGVIYQSQFASAAAQYNGDIDRVIDFWSVDPTVAAANVNVASSKYTDDDDE